MPAFRFANAGRGTGIMTSLDLSHVRAALALDDFDVRAAHRRMAPQPRALSRSSQKSGQARQASVLVLLYAYHGSLAFALIRRTANPHDVHSGQISLPGGSREDGETPLETALREAREELGVQEPIDVIGRLSCIYIPPSDFEVLPFVGMMSGYPAWQPDRTEVVEVIDFPLDWLLDDSREVVEDWPFGEGVFRVPWYNVNGYKVWGATAIILSEFEQRLRTVLAG